MTLSFCLSTLSGQFSELVSSFCQEMPHAEMEGVEVIIASWPPLTPSITSTMKDTVSSSPISKWVKVPKHGTFPLISHLCCHLILNSAQCCTFPLLQLGGRVKAQWPSRHCRPWPFQCLLWLRPLTRQERRTLWTLLNILLYFQVQQMTLMQMNWDVIRPRSCWQCDAKGYRLHSFLHPLAQSIFAAILTNIVLLIKISGVKLISKIGVLDQEN